MTIPIKIISKKEYLKENLEPSQEQVWDGISDLWQGFRVKPILIVEEFLKNKKGKVIDLGCGSGRNMVPNKNIEYSGVDFSKRQLKHAKEFVKKNKLNAKLFKSKIDKLPMFDDEMFDYGLFIATLHCLETEEERENSLKEFYRILKKGAEAIITTWDSSDQRFNGLKGDIYMSWRQDGKLHMRYYYLYSKNELIKLLKDVGFEILEIYNKIGHDRFSKKNLIIRVNK